MQENNYELLTTGFGVLVGIFAFVGLRSYFNRKKEEKELLSKMKTAKEKNIGLGKGKSSTIKKMEIS